MATANTLPALHSQKPPKFTNTLNSGWFRAVFSNFSVALKNPTNFSRGTDPTQQRLGNDNTCPRNSLSASRQKKKREELYVFYTIACCTGHTNIRGAWRINSQSPGEVAPPSRAVPCLCWRDPSPSGHESILSREGRSCPSGAFYRRGFADQASAEV